MRKHFTYREYNFVVDVQLNCYREGKHPDDCLGLAGGSTEGGFVHNAQISHTGKAPFEREFEGANDKTLVEDLLRLEQAAKDWVDARLADPKKVLYDELAELGYK